MKNEQDDWFDDLPPRKTLCEFFAQVGPPAGPPPAPEFEQPTPDRLGPLFDGPGRQPASPAPPPPDRPGPELPVSPDLGDEPF